MIAIIGILAATVLASLGTARSSGSDASARGNINSMKAQAEILFTTETSYDNVCTGTSTATLRAAIGSNSADSDGSLTANGGPSTATAGFCNDNASNWVIIAPMRNGGNAFCADSTGFSGDVPVNRLSASTDFVCGS